MSNKRLFAILLFSPWIWVSDYRLVKFVFLPNYPQIIRRGLRIVLIFASECSPQGNLATVSGSSGRYYFGEWNESKIFVEWFEINDEFENFGFVLDFVSLVVFGQWTNDYERYNYSNFALKFDWCSSVWSNSDWKQLHLLTVSWICDFSNHLCLWFIKSISVIIYYDHGEKHFTNTSATGIWKCSD